MCVLFPCSLKFPRLYLFLLHLFSEHLPQAAINAALHAQMDGALDKVAEVKRVVDDANAQLKKVETNLQSSLLSLHTNDDITKTSGSSEHAPKGFEEFLFLKLPPLSSLQQISPFNPLRIKSPFFNLFPFVLIPACVNSSVSCIRHQGDSSFSLECYPFTSSLPIPAFTPPSSFPLQALLPNASSSVTMSLLGVEVQESLCSILSHLHAAMRGAAAVLPSSEDLEEEEDSFLNQEEEALPFTPTNHSTWEMVVRQSASLLHTLSPSLPSASSSAAPPSAPLPSRLTWESNVGAFVTGVGTSSATGGEARVRWTAVQQVMGQ